MGSQVLADMVLTSMSAILPGLYFLLMVESVEGVKKYRYKFLMKGDLLEKLNNAITVGMVGYTLFITSMPIFNWFFGTLFNVTLEQAIIGTGIGVQTTLLVLLGMMNITMAYIGLQK